MSRLSFTCLVLSLSLAARVSAQPDQPPATQLDFSRLRLPPGTIVYVSDPERALIISGPLTALTPTSIQVHGYTFEPTPLLRIEKPGDTIWDGASAGFLIGGLMGVTVGAEGCLHRPRAVCFVQGGLAYGLVGAFIDWKHKGRTTVFRGAPAATGQRRDLAAPTGPTATAGPAIDATAIGLKVGDTIAIVGDTGATWSGRLTQVSASGLRIGAVDVAPASAVAIYRIGDPVWDGAAMGAAFGGLLAGVAGCSARCIGVEATIFAGVGAWIDWLEVRRTLVYGTPVAKDRITLRVVPEMGRRKAVALALRF